ncbi:hypothetical protein OH687_26805 [Burkholderia anthina]|nr:hypothetical protein OH687_26805 [Burkholderia anthina]
MIRARGQRGEGNKRGAAHEQRAREDSSHGKGKRRRKAVNDTQRECKKCEKRGATARMNGAIDLDFKPA